MFLKSQKIILGVFLLVAVFVWRAVFVGSSGLLLVSFLDVGQGDAIFIETPSGKQVLIDGGYGRQVLSRLGRVMPGYDKSIDLVIATHTDSDHLGGLIEVLKSYDVRTVVENGFQDNSVLLAEGNKEVEKNGARREIVKAGDQFILDNGVSLKILGPFSEDIKETPDKSNEVMVVAQLVYGETEFLFTGDIERGDEIRLASSGAELKSDVLKVAHHGSQYSTTRLFLEKVMPVYTVISVGKKNRYGHPHTETLSRLASIGSTLFRTDYDGGITFMSNGRFLSLRR